MFPMRTDNQIAMIMGPPCGSPRSQVGPRWVPCRPHGPCCQGILSIGVILVLRNASQHTWHTNSSILLFHNKKLNATNNVSFITPCYALPCLNTHHQYHDYNNHVHSFAITISHEKYIWFSYKSIVKFTIGNTDLSFHITPDIYVCVDSLFFV